MTTSAWRGARSCGGAVAFAVVAACASHAPSGSGSVPYLDDASFRRAELEGASLVNPANGYSTLRLDHYATGTAGDWDALPEWNPAVDPIEARELDAAGGASVTSFAATPEALLRFRSR